ncbi:MAG: DUF305 domain-containing protein, partial [Vicinamibacterales bacterium]
PPQQNVPIVQPGAPGTASQTVSAAKASDESRVQYTDADVQFMQGMIHHHAQALDMVDLLNQNTSTPEMLQLGKRIYISQTDEIGMMQRWLRARGKDVPDPRAHEMADMPGMSMDRAMMPGMLTPDEMKHLASLKGAAFDKTFLEGMIKHHGGALTMVKDLLATPGAAQDADIFNYAATIEADQKAEIERMSDMLARINSPGSTPNAARRP